MPFGTDSTLQSTPVSPVRTSAVPPLLFPWLSPPASSRFSLILPLRCPAQDLKLLFAFCLSSVHMKIEEKISLTCGRDGGLQNMELHGMIMLHISDEKFARIRLHVENDDKRGVQLQVQPARCPALSCRHSGVKW